jgi:hypothetical protein
MNHRTLLSKYSCLICNFMLKELAALYLRIEHLEWQYSKAVSFVFRGTMSFTYCLLKAFCSVQPNLIPIFFIKDSPNLINIHQAATQPTFVSGILRFFESRQAPSSCNCLLHTRDQHRNAEDKRHSKSTKKSVNCLR